jgi:hypothetical protein
VGAVIDSVNGPAMLMWKINDPRKGGILKTEAHTGGINMGRDADDRVHQLIENSSM